MGPPIGGSEIPEQENSTLIGEEGPIAKKYRLQRDM